MKPRLDDALNAALMTAVAAALLGVCVPEEHHESPTQVASNTAMTTTQLASLQARSWRRHSSDARDVVKMLDDLAVDLVELSGEP